MCEACPEMVNHNLHSPPCPLMHEFGSPTPDCRCPDTPGNAKRSHPTKPVSQSPAQEQS